jgi:saccharopine dehydrogenase (NAD+, L-glutamate forming)
MLIWDEMARDSGIILLNEMGLDPGIDHMSACQMLDEIKRKGGVIKSFKSHCGGLVSKESDNNPWHYKFTWNPRNVVLAGQGEKPIQWLENGAQKTLQYEELFANAQPIKLQSGEAFETYPNRDSLSYIDVYGLKGVETFYRGTLRAEGFCDAWNFLVQFGYCDDKTEIVFNANETYGNFFSRLVEANKSNFVNKTEIGSERFEKFLWLELHEKDEIGLQKATAAQVLQKRLEEKWKFEATDTDRVVMLHEVEYELNGKRFKQTAELDRSGTLEHTAMAETVGLPIAIAVKLILDGSIKKSGVLRPISKEIYVPVLDALKQYGIAFQHNEMQL